MKHTFKIVSYFIVFTTLTFSAFAQKVKVKKGVVFVDKKEIPVYVDSKEKDTYVFSDKSTEEVFVTVNYKFKNIDEETSYKWLVLSREDSEFINEVDMEFLSFTLKLGNSITEFLMKKLEFFDTSGNVNTNKISDFFSQKRERTSKEAYEGDVVEKGGRQTRFDETSKLGIKVDQETRKIYRDPVGNISNPSGYNGQPNSNDELIGVFSINEYNKIEVRDLSDYLVAIASVGKWEEVTVSLPLLEKEFKYKAKTHFDINSSSNVKDFAVELVRYLHAEDIRLGNEIKIKQEAEENARLKAAKEQYIQNKINSSNIYGEPGFVIDENGGQIYGKIIILFEDIESPNSRIATTVSIGNGDGSYGKSVTIKYKEKKIKEYKDKNGDISGIKSKFVKRSKSLSAKNEISFCIDEGNKSTGCYAGLRILKANTLNLNDAKIRKSIFAKEILKGDKVALYQHMVNKKYIIKSENQDLAYEFILDNAEKNIKILSQYLGNECDWKSSYRNIDFTDEEKIKELINFYNTSCN